jgi:hypothetical protein
MVSVWVGKREGGTCYSSNIHTRPKSAGSFPLLLLFWTGEEVSPRGIVDEVEVERQGRGRKGERSCLTQRVSGKD